ncbi:MAG: MBL fold metallo-hydrolase [Oligoflexia bacterium]|nr:MBL fold metallo-hydrolase [Oligoflexia bacterium]
MKINIIFLIISFLQLMAALMLLSSCTSSQHNIIVGQNLNLNSYQNQKGEFQNIYPSEMLGETIYDKIDFLKDEEKAKKEYFNFGFKHDNINIDLTKGFIPDDFIVKPNLDRLKNNNEKTQITWLGHASFLIQFGHGTNILTDPTFYNLPFAFLFDRLKRVSPSIVKEDNLDFVSAITISHNHFDHLDFETINNFNTDKVSFFVPLNLQKKFNSSFQSVTAMGWYASQKYKDLTISFLPANHWSKRSLWDRNKTLWGGYLFENNNKKIYFTGDTGYSQIFNDIKKRYGPIDVCLIPIVAYKPVHYRHSHLSPENALQVAKDLDCKIMIPWGYGTFTLGHEHVLEPLRRLLKAYADGKSVDNKSNYNFELKILKMGETFELDSTEISIPKGVHPK